MNKKIKVVSGSPDLSWWGLPALDDLGEILNKTLLKAVEQAIAYAFSSGDSYIRFPAALGEEDGEYEGDPLALEFVVAVGADGKCPKFELSLRDMLEWPIECCSEDGTFSPGLGLLSSALRSLADEIDEAIDSGNKKK